MVLITPVFAYICLAQVPIKFRVTPKANARYEYSASLEITGADPKHDRMKMDMSYAERVVSVEPKKIVISSFISSVKTDAIGMFKEAAQQFTTLNGFSFQSELDEFGDKKKATANGSEIGLSNDGDIVFPEKALSAGDTWTTDIDVAGKPVKVEYKFEGSETFEKHSLYKFTRKFLPGQAVTATEPTIMLIQPEDGRLVRSTGKYEMKVQGFEFKTSFKVQLLSKKGS